MKDKIIAKKVLISLYVGTTLLFIVSTFFNQSISNWIGGHFVVFFVSLIMILLAWFIGILSKEDVMGTKSFTNMKFYLLLIQLIISVVISDLSIQKIPFYGEIFGSLQNFISNGQYDRTFKVLVLLSPTIVYILQTFFKRLIRIEKLLEETKEQKRQYFKIPDEE